MVRRATTAALTAVWLACAGAAPAAATVLIATSDELPQYEAPVSAFQRATGYEVVTVNLGSTRDQAQRRLREAAATHEPRAVYALGARAAYLTRHALPDTPLVFGMVVGWQRYGLGDGSVTGVAVEIPVASLFTRFKLMLSDVESIGVIYSSDIDTELLEEARSAASTLGMRLVEEAVGHADEVPGAYRRIRTEVDALWMVPDPVVVTHDNFAYLAKRTRHDKIAFLAFSENFVRAGALLSVAPSYETMGSQAAVLLERLLADSDHPPHVQAPVGSTLVVNAETARELGMTLDATAIGMADVIIDLARSEETPAK